MTQISPITEGDVSWYSN